MDRATLAACLNEWMRRYTEAPAEFEAEFETVGRFLSEQGGGSEPTYGETSAAYLAAIAADLSLAAAA